MPVMRFDPKVGVQLSTLVVMQSTQSEGTFSTLVLRHSVVLVLGCSYSVVLSSTQLKPYSELSMYVARACLGCLEHSAKKTWDLKTWDLKAYKSVRSACFNTALLCPRLAAVRRTGETCGTSRCTAGRVSTWTASRSLGC